MSSTDVMAVAGSGASGSGDDLRAAIEAEVAARFQQQLAERDAKIAKLKNHLRARHKGMRSVARIFKQKDRRLVQDVLAHKPADEGEGEAPPQTPSPAPADGDESETPPPSAGPRAPRARSPPMAAIPENTSLTGSMPSRGLGGVGDGESSPSVSLDGLSPGRGVEATTVVAPADAVLPTLPTVAVPPQALSPPPTPSRRRASAAAVLSVRAKPPPDWTATSGTRLWAWGLVGKTAPFLRGAGGGGASGSVASGDGSDGLRVPRTAVKPTPDVMPVLETASLLSVAASGEAVLFLTKSGDVFQWTVGLPTAAELEALQTGDGASTASEPAFASTSGAGAGQVPHPLQPADGTPRVGPTQPPRLVQTFARTRALTGSRVVSVACGPQHCAAITDANELFTWGAGDNGRLGHGSDRNEVSPRLVMALLEEDVVGVGTGGAHTAAVTVGGKLFAWGRGRNGRLGTGGHGDESTPKLLDTLGAHAVKQVSCGRSFTACVTAGKALFVWGKNTEKQCGFDSSPDDDVLIPHRVFSVAGVPSPPPPPSPPASPSASLSPPPFMPGFVSVSCGHSHVVALTDDSRVFCWGSNLYGQAGGLHMHEQCRNVSIPSPVRTASLLPDGDTVALVTAGTYHSVACSLNGATLVWGRNREGALGLGDIVDRNMPVRVSPGRASTPVTPSMSTPPAGGWKHASAIACGVSFTMLVESAPSSSRPASRRRMSLAGSRLSPRVAMPALSPQGGSQSPQEAPATPTAAGGMVIIPGGPFDLEGSTAPSPVAHTESPHLVAVSPELSPVGSPVMRPERLAARGGGEGDATTPAPPPPQPPPPPPHVPSMGAVEFEEVSGGSSSDEDDADEQQRNRQVPTVRKRQQSRVWEEQDLPLERQWARLVPQWETVKHLGSTRELWLRGVPARLRGRVWPLVIGNALRTTPELYDMCLSRARQLRSWNLQRGRERLDSAHSRGRSNSAVHSTAGDLPPVSAFIGREDSLDLIDTDLPRTFPSLRLFGKSEPLYLQLRNVLDAFVCFRPDVGYVQGMSYLAAVLCLYMDNSYIVFQCLSNLVMREHVFAFFQMDVVVLKRYYIVYNRMLKHHAPAMFDHLIALHIDSEMYLFPWLQTLFVKCLPRRTVSRVWDCFFLEGTWYLFRVALALLDLLSPNLLGTSFEDSIQLLTVSPVKKPLWTAVHDEAVLFAAIDAVDIPVELISEIDTVVHDAFFFHADAEDARRRAAAAAAREDRPRRSPGRRHTVSLARSPARGAAGGGGSHTKDEIAELFT